MARMILYIYGPMEGESEEAATRSAKGAIRAALADSGWSSMDLNREMLACPIELEGVMIPFPHPIPPLAYHPTAAKACAIPSPSGQFVCTLFAGHALRQHVASDEVRTLAIWNQTT